MSAVTILILTSAALFGFSLVELAPWRRRAVLRRLSELEHYDPHSPTSREGGLSQVLRQDVMLILRKIGSRKETSNEGLRARLLQAGFRHPHMSAIYRGACVASLALGATCTTLLAGVARGGPASVMVLGAYGGLIGWLAPRWYVSRTVSKRQREMQRALPDSLDLLVVCVEAGLGLNHSLQRVAQEIGSVSPALGQELTTVNLEIRAGAPRLEALKNLGERTGLDDLRSLAAMLVQTERFGTPVADALRAYAESLRTKRRQRAEEAAAKTTVKLLFPLVLFIFPPLYIVILGPAVIQMIRALNGLE